MKPMTASEMGKKGGAAKTPKKRKASRDNLALARFTLKKQRMLKKTGH